MQGLVIAMIFLFVGVAGAAAVFEYMPDPGSAPSIYDDFAWSSTANGFWHVNAIGAKAIIKNSILTLTGHQIELDRRLQTDPTETIAVVKVRGLSFKRFGMGLGIYHSGTLSMEFDSEGIKCGRATDHGYFINILKRWKKPPIGQWFYLELDVTNPYPQNGLSPKAWAKVQKLDYSKQKPVTVRCAAYDATGRLIKSITPTRPRTNTHYVGLDEAFLRTWDSHNLYQVDWFYAGPPSGSPARTVIKG